MRIIRTTTAILGVAAIAASLAACSSGPKDGEVALWTPLTGPDGSYMKDLIDEYNVQADGCNVKFNQIPADDLYTKIYSVAKSSDNKPQLMLIHGPRVGEFARAGLIEPLDYLTEYQPELVESNYIPAAWAQGVYDGTDYGIPLDVHGIVTFYNTDLLEQYGVTDWVEGDGVITVNELKTLEGKLPDDMYAMPSQFIPAVVENQIVSAGGFAPNGELDLMQPEMFDIYQNFVELNEAGLIGPEDTDSYQLFNSGHALVFPDGTWGIANRNEIEGLNWGITHNLQLDTMPVTNTLEAHTFVQMKDDKRSDVTNECVADFLEFMRTNSASWGEAGQVVAAEAAFNTEEFAAQPQAFLTNTPEGQASLTANDYMYTPYVMEALWQKSQDIVQGRVTVEEGLQAMQDQVAAKIAENEATQSGAKSDASTDDASSED